jgi:pimeloyl-ACP methyl ester carboxylesterase
MLLPRRAFLGVRLPADAEAFSAAGARIAGVLPGGMAERAGLAAGDRLVTLAGLPLRDPCELGEALRRAGAADAAELVWDGGAATVPVVPHPREPEVEHGELAVDGARLRTLVVATPAPRATVLVVQGIACESIDLATRPDEPLAGLIRAWAAAGIAVVRVDRRGCGDSEGGPCGEVDFATDLADHKAALALLPARPRFLFGHSVGGMVAPLLAAELELDGVMVYGTSTARWRDCMIETTRRQLAMRGADAAEIERRAAALDARIGVDGLNGRSARYHAQLAAIDLAAGWARVRAPVRIYRGEHDWVVGAEEQAAIAAITGGALVDLPGLDHLLGWHPDRESSTRDYGAGRFDPAIAVDSAAWMVRSRP